MCSSEGLKEGAHHLLKEFSRLRSFNPLISFLACELRGDVELFWHPSFIVIDAPALVMRHVACVSKQSQNKTKPNAINSCDMVVGT